MMFGFLKGSFVGDVLKLSIGTLGGRLIVLAALPFVTRLYSPENFTLLAAYLGIVSTTAVGACLRFDIAIPLADDDTDAAHLLALALLSLAVIVAAAMFLILMIPHRLAEWLGNPKIVSHLWLVPLGIASTGSYAAFQFWATRARRFRTIARTKVSQAIAGVSAILGLGWAGIVPFGLLFGNMLLNGAGGINLGISAWRLDRRRFQEFSLSVLGATFSKYWRYPMISTPEALLNIAGTQVPVLLIAAQAGTEAGFLLLAMQFMMVPMQLLGHSISQVYMSRAPEELRSGRLANFTLSIMRRLIMVGVGPLCLAGVLAPIIFPWLFGEEWDRAGEIVAWIVPWMVLRFVSSPVSPIMYLVRRQKAMIILTTIGAVLRIGGVKLGMASDYYTPIIGFILGNIVYYATVMGFVLAATGAESHQKSNLLKIFFDWRNLIPITLWIINFLIK